MEKINSGIPQRSVLELFLFLIYINDLPDGIISICKIFANYASLFSEVLEINKYVRELNTDLEKIIRISLLHVCGKIFWRVTENFLV